MWLRPAKLILRIAGMVLFIAGFVIVMFFTEGSGGIQKRDPLTLVGFGLCIGGMFFSLLSFAIDVGLRFFSKRPPSQ